MIPPRGAHRTCVCRPASYGTIMVLHNRDDWLSYSPNPPLIFGMVQFENGAKFMAEFTGFDPSAVEVGMPVEMVFRVKEYEKERNFRHYFWKAAPKSNGMKEG